MFLFNFIVQIKKKFNNFIKIIIFKLILFKKITEIKFYLIY